jgi:putative peptidoglycan lipid II flippase
MESLKKTLNYSLRLALLIDIPSTVGLYLLSGLIVSVLFQRGEFSYADSIATTAALAMFALKIPFVSGVRNIVPAFFSLKDAKTPVYIAVVAVIINGIAAVLLMHKYLYVGLAAALNISAVANYFLLLYMLRRKIGRLGGVKLLMSATRTFAASLIMGAGIYAATEFFSVDSIRSFPGRVAVLLTIMSVAAVVFLAVIRKISPEEYRALKAIVRGRRKKIVL